MLCSIFLDPNFKRILYLMQGWTFSVVLIGAKPEFKELKSQPGSPSLLSAVSSRLNSRTLDSQLPLKQTNSLISFLVLSLGLLQYILLLLTAYYAVIGTFRAVRVLD